MSDIKENHNQVLNDRVQESSILNHSESGPSPSPEALRIEVIRHTEGFDSLKSEWNNLVNEAGGFIFQTFEWNRTWWKYFGSEESLYLIAIYHEDTLAAVMPLFRDRVSLFDREVYSCLRFLGSTVSQPEGEELMGMIAYSDYLDVIIRPGYEAPVYLSLMRYFKSDRPDFNEIILDEVPENSTLLDYLLPLLDEREYDYSAETCSVVPIINLDCSWDEYLDNMSKKSRYNARRNVKKVYKESHKTFDILEAGNENDLTAAYDQLVQLHQQRWNNLGYPGTFAEKRMYQFLREIVRLFYKNGWMQFKMAVPVEGNGKCVAIDLILKYRDRVYMLHRALNDESPHAKKSPGNVLMYNILREVAEGESKVFDFLRGAHEFKLRSANEVTENRVIRIENPLKKGRLSSMLVKLLIRLKRRLKVEHYQIRLFFTGTPFYRGLRNYCSFLYRRVNRKMEEEED